MSVQTEQVEQEVFNFQAEAVQILDLMVHSLYSNKEIFLRELISNASDAIDRLRLELLARSELPEAEGRLRIRIGYDKDAGTITIADNGIGMSREEVIQNIGTIAKSGTGEFLRSLTGDQRKDAAMIGQFGVGFYSSFIVSERVVLTTRRAGLEPSEGVRWESDGKGEYTLETIERPERGTTIVLHLRDGEDDLANGWRLRSIIEKYSDHIRVPILMPGEREDKAEEAAGTAGTDITVNRASALWARPKSELTDTEYNDFYRHIAGEPTDPLTWVHAKIEGTYDYTLLLFIPSRAPHDLWVPQARRGVRLHVQRVFILEDTGQILPNYLRFVRGVIDSTDLPLNVSREILQGSRAVGNIRTTAVKKVLKRLAELAESEPEKYTAFWKEFGTALKEGIADDYSNRNEIAKLLRFTSTKSATDDPDTSLDAYVARMKEGQEHIYYLLAPSSTAAKSSPHLEAFRTKGVEVLLLSEGVDNWVVSSLREYDGKELQSVAQGAGDLGALADEEERQTKEQADAEYADLLGKLKAHLAGQAWDVRLSTRLTTSPACIVSNEPEIDINLMQRMRGTGLPRQAVLELNPTHPLIQRLNRAQGGEHLREWAQVLFNQAVLTLSARIEDPTTFVQQLNSLLTALTDEQVPGTHEDAG
ncbi:molecular chaperone HtpG [Streptomyces phyllanthi]|uniref:Chaperone protein HtpG n=1 Tax=Streptomyces phyllanthi TaxID=1803180 RepID=A0A5N8VY12_9ACTN|nr:molecular chaperone HtpG [Streptomyces phyllanthi]MPY39596.1 molecular chaperone HtpG [Streptomyces phyllanthi]